MHIVQLSLVCGALLGPDLAKHSMNTSHEHVLSDMRKEVQEIVELEVIQSSVKPWPSPVVLVAK